MAVGLGQPPHYLSHNFPHPFNQSQLMPNPQHLHQLVSHGFPQVTVFPIQQLVSDDLGGNVRCGYAIGLGGQSALASLGSSWRGKR